MANTPLLNKLGCGNHHSAAIGSLGHLYVWGSNLDGQLGLSDEYTNISDPISIHLTFEFYQLKVKQISCGAKFTAIVATDKKESELHQPIPLTPEADKFVNVFRNYLTKHNQTLFQVFKSPTIKQQAFEDVVENVLKYDVDKLPTILQDLEMKIPGGKVILEGLNRHIIGFDQAAGMAILLGNAFEAPKGEDEEDQDDEPQGQITEKDLEMTFIHLPEQQHVRKIAAGQQHCLLLSDKGKIYCYGQDGSGGIVLGLDNLNSNTFVRTPTIIDSVANKNFIDIACGVYHNLALEEKKSSKHNPKVYAWGLGSNGRLGLESVEDQVKPAEILSLKNDKVQKIYAGYTRSAIITEEGAVKTWGCGAYGCLGNDSSSMDDECSPKRAIIGFDYVRSLAFGEKITVFVVGKNGELYGCGQLKPEPELPEQVPISITHEKSRAHEEKFVEVSAGKYHCLALTFDGTIYSWGVNRENILGRRIVEEKKTSTFQTHTIEGQGPTKPMTTDAPRIQKPMEQLTSVEAIDDFRYQFFIDKTEQSRAEQEESKIEAKEIKQVGC